MQEQLRRVTEQGISDGREIIRLEQKARREAEQEMARRMEEERRRAYDQQRIAYERQMREYRRQQERMMQAAQAQGRAQRPSDSSQPDRNRVARRRESAGQRNVPPKPQFGPLGFYTPKPEPTGDRTAGRRADKRK